MAACVAPRAVARPRLDRRRVSRSPVVRRTTRASSEADAEKRILESATRRTSGTPRPLPPNFDLDTAVLLGGFAFESYSTPEGGVVDADVQGGSTAYLSDFVREVYLGVLEVTMVRAEGLPRGDTLGLSDPYCVVSVGGGSSARTGTKRFTLDPKWDDEAPMRLLVKRTRPGDSHVRQRRQPDADGARARRGRRQIRRLTRRHEAAPARTHRRQFGEDPAHR